MKKVLMMVCAMGLLSACAPRDEAYNRTGSGAISFYTHKFDDGTTCYIAEDRTGHAHAMSCKTVKEQ